MTGTGTGSGKIVCYGVKKMYIPDYGLPVDQGCGREELLRLCWLSLIRRSLSAHATKLWIRRTSDETKKNKENGFGSKNVCVLSHI